MVRCRVWCRASYFNECGPSEFPCVFGSTHLKKKPPLPGTEYRDERFRHRAGEAEHAAFHASSVPCPHESKCVLASACPGEVLRSYAELYGLDELRAVSLRDLVEAPHASPPNPRSLQGRGGTRASFKLRKRCSYAKGAHHFSRSGTPFTRVDGHARIILALDASEKWEIYFTPCPTTRHVCNRLWTSTR